LVIKQYKLIVTKRQFLLLYFY